MEKGFNFGSNKAHEKAVRFVIETCKTRKYQISEDVGELACDFIVKQAGSKGVLYYVSVLKMTKSSKYGATTLSEWQFAYKHENNFLFAVAIGDCESSNTTDVYFYTPNDMCKMSHLPPFYYKCSVTKDFLDDKYKNIKTKRTRIIPNNEVFTPLNGKTKPTKKNVKNAETFFKKMVSNS